MLCIASFIVLLVLSIFSAKYRPYVKEAYDCVFRRVTFRPCNTGFDTKVRSAIVVSLAKKSERLATWFNRYFELVSWFFVLTFIASLLWTIRGGYLFWTTGSCNGMNQGGFCVLDPGGENNAVSTTGIECRSGGDPVGNLTLDGVNVGNKESIVFIGCYACKYSKQTYPLIKKLESDNNAPVEFIFYPTHKESEYLFAYDYSIKQLYPEKYLAWVDAMYKLPMDQVANKSEALKIINEMSMDVEKIENYLSLNENKSSMQRLKYEIDKTGIYGTPTIFIKGKPVVGPKPDRVYRIMWTGSLF